MHLLDWIVIGLFCVVLSGIVIWFAIGASNFASGSEHLIGLAGGTHHSCFPYDLTVEYRVDYAEISGVQEGTQDERGVSYVEQGADIICL